MTDYVLLQQDKHLIIDPSHPVDPVTGAMVVSARTHGFENVLTRMRIVNWRDAQAFEARLASISFEGVEEDYGERVIGNVFAAWGFVRESRRKLYYYVIVSTLAEREFVRWKVFGKAS